MYFHTTRNGAGKKSDIFRAKFVDGHFAEPERLGPPIHTSEYQGAPYISPDESFIIYFQINLLRKSQNLIYV